MRSTSEPVHVPHFDPTLFTAPTENGRTPFVSVSRAHHEVSCAALDMPTASNGMAGSQFARTEVSSRATALSAGYIQRQGGRLACSG